MGKRNLSYSPITFLLEAHELLRTKIIRKLVSYHLMTFCNKAFSNKFTQRLVFFSFLFSFFFTETPNSSES